MKNDGTQFFGTKKEIEEWLDKYNIKSDTINDDLSVDVNNNVDLSYKELKFIPVNFRNVTGNFWCYGNQLTSLIGSPKTVKGDFWCSHNQLTNLIGAPKSVAGNFLCVNNKLKNLIGGPESVGGDFLVQGNLLNSLLEFDGRGLKGVVHFNITKKSFKEPEIIPILKKYYNKKSKRYMLTAGEFYDNIKPQIEKEILQQKLINSKIKNKTRISLL